MEEAGGRTKHRMILIPRSPAAPPPPPASAAAAGSEGAGHRTSIEMRHVPSVLVLTIASCHGSLDLTTHHSTYFRRSPPLSSPF